MDVAKRITELRESKGYTVNKLANLCGLSQSFVRQLELGEKNPTVSSIELLCEALGITIEHFFAVSSDDDKNKLLIFAYNNATDSIREAVDKLLDM